MPNPWALMVIAIGVLVMIIGIKGSYPNVVKALKSSSTPTRTSSAPLPRPTLSQ